LEKNAVVLVFQCQMTRELVNTLEPAHRVFHFIYITYISMENHPVCWKYGKH